MAKTSSPPIVDEEAEMNRRFEKLEKDSERSAGILDKLAKKLLGDDPTPPPNPPTPPTPPTPPESNGTKKFFQDLGILSKD